MTDGSTGWQKSQVKSLCTLGKQCLSWNFLTNEEAFWTWILIFRDISSPVLSLPLLSPNWPTSFCAYPFRLQHGVEETAAECRKLGATAHAYVVDCGNRDDIYNSVKQVRLQMTHFFKWFCIHWHGKCKVSCWWPDSITTEEAVKKEGHILSPCIESTHSGYSYC